MEKVLIVVTNHETLGREGKKTGLWLGELTGFYHEVKVLYDVDIISTAPGRVPLDPLSVMSVFVNKETRKYYMDDAFMEKIRNPRTPAEIDPNEYAAVYFAGGHGTMWDFPENEKLQTIVRTVYENGGIVSAVCHGPAALFNVQLSNGEYMVTGHLVSGFADFEEKLMGMTKYLPFSLEQKLVERGAAYRQAKIPFTPCVVESGRLITGQNPASVKGVAKRTVELLNAASRHV